MAERNCFSFARTVVDGAVGDWDLSRLRAALAQQPAGLAAAAGGALLVSLHGLVASLVGPTLTGQLLDRVWTSLFGGSPSEDPS